jgi:Zn-finger nucleic acid-binding protein
MSSQMPGETNQCQNCGEVLVAFELEGVEIDRCASCGGTWLDAGEIEQIIRLSNAEPGPLTEILDETPAGSVTGRKCPRCGRPLHRVELGGEDALEIDVCARGHGYWFDAGELRQLIARFVGGEEGAVAGFLGRMFRNDIQSKTGGE